MGLIIAHGYEVRLFMHISFFLKIKQVYLCFFIYKFNK